MPCPPLPWLRLLAVLLVVAGCGASQQQQQQQQQQPEPNGSEPYRDWLEALISQAVTAATEPLLRRLADGLERLDSQLDVLDTRLDNQGHKLDGLTTRLDNQDHKLDGLTTRLDNRDHNLDGLLTNRLDNQDHKLDGLAIKLENRNSELNNHSSKLEGRLMVRLDNQDFKMDGLTAKLLNQESKLDEIRNALTTSLSSQDSKLNGLVTTLSNQDAELNGLVSSLSSQDSKLNGLVTQMNEEYTNVSTRAPLPRDCSDMPAGSQSGIHQLQPGLGHSQPPVPAFCDLDNDGGGWIVIQRRADIQPRQNFFRNWADYKEGFGELDEEFWWGLEYLWTVTSARDRQYELRIDLGDFDNAKRYAVYRSFKISSESDGYRLLAKNYTGNAGDSMSGNDGQMFSTKDKYQDQSSGDCTASHQGGWWFNYCGYSNLNGPYLSGESPGKYGVYWYTWRVYSYSLKTVEMKIRPI